MRELQLVTRPAGSSNRWLTRLMRRSDSSGSGGSSSRQPSPPLEGMTQTHHPMDSVSHWAIKDGDQYHELRRETDGKMRFSRRKWTPDEEKEIQARSTFTWTDRPQGDLEMIGT